MQIVYVILVVRETREKKVLKHIGAKIQYICQESAILTFLLVLTLFSYLQNSKFYESQSYSNLQTLVILAVFVAIAAQLISVIWSIVHSIKEFVKSRADKKDAERTKRIEMSLKEVEADVDEFEGGESAPEFRQVAVREPEVIEGSVSIIELHRLEEEPINNPRNVELLGASSFVFNKATDSKFE